MIPQASNFQYVELLQQTLIDLEVLMYYFNALPCGEDLNSGKPVNPNSVCLVSEEGKQVKLLRTPKPFALFEFSFFL
jgi:hypothetical protein